MTKQEILYQVISNVTNELAWIAYTIHNQELQGVALQDVQVRVDCLNSTLQQSFSELFDLHTNTQVNNSIVLLRRENNNKEFYRNSAQSKLDAKRLYDKQAFDLFERMLETVRQGSAMMLLGLLDRYDNINSIMQQIDDLEQLMNHQGDNIDLCKLEKFFVLCIKYNSLQFLDIFIESYTYIPEADNLTSIYKSAAAPALYLGAKPDPAELLQYATPEVMVVAWQQVPHVNIDLDTIVNFLSNQDDLSENLENFVHASQRNLETLLYLYNCILIKYSTNQVDSILRELLDKLYSVPRLSTLALNRSILLQSVDINSDKLLQERYVSNLYILQADSPKLLPGFIALLMVKGLEFAKGVRVLLDEYQYRPISDFEVYVNKNLLLQELDAVIVDLTPISLEQSIKYAITNLDFIACAHLDLSGVDAKLITHYILDLASKQSLNSFLHNVDLPIIVWNNLLSNHAFMCEYPITLDRALAKAHCKSILDFWHVHHAGNDALFAVVMSRFLLEYNDGAAFDFFESLLAKNDYEFVLHVFKMFLNEDAYDQFIDAIIDIDLDDTNEKFMVLVAIIYTQHLLTNDEGGCDQLLNSKDEIKNRLVSLECVVNPKRYLADPLNRKIYNSHATLLKSSRSYVLTKQFAAYYVDTIDTDQNCNSLKICNKKLIHDAIVADDASKFNGITFDPVDEIEAGNLLRERLRLHIKMHKNKKSPKNKAGLNLDRFKQFLLSINLPQQIWAQLCQVPDFFDYYQEVLVRFVGTLSCADLFTMNVQIELIKQIRSCAYLYKDNDNFLKSTLQKVIAGGKEFNQRFIVLFENVRRSESESDLDLDYVFAEINLFRSLNLIYTQHDGKNLLMLAIEKRFTNLQNHLMYINSPTPDHEDKVTVRKLVYNIGLKDSHGRSVLHYWATFACLDFELLGQLLPDYILHVKSKRIAAANDVNIWINEFSDKDQKTFIHYLLDHNHEDIAYNALSAIFALDIHDDLSPAITNVNPAGNNVFVFVEENRWFLVLELIYNKMQALFVNSYVKHDAVLYKYLDSHHDIFSIQFGYGTAAVFAMNDDLDSAKRIILMQANMRNNVYTQIYSGLVQTHSAEQKESLHKSLLANMDNIFGFRMFSNLINLYVSTHNPHLLKFLHDPEIREGFSTIKITDHDGWKTPFQKFSPIYREMFELSHSVGVVYDCVDKDGISPMHVAVSCNNLELITFLYTKINIKISQDVLFMIALNIDSHATPVIKCVFSQFMLENPEIDIRDLVNDKGYDLLSLALSRSRTLDKCKYLIEDLKFDIDKEYGVDKLTVLMEVIKRIFPVEDVLYLLDRGADPHHYDRLGCPTFTYLVAHYTDIDLINRFLEENAFLLNLADSLCTPLHYAVNFGAHDVLILLLKHATQAGFIQNVINAQDHDGKTALHLASTKARFNCVKILLESGADLAIKDVFGKNSLDYFPKLSDSDNQMLMQYSKILKNNESQTSADKKNIKVKGELKNHKLN